MAWDGRSKNPATGKMGVVSVGILGEPLPALPESLVARVDRSEDRSEKLPGIVHPTAITNETSCEGRELNPYRSNPAGT